jgi:Zn-dependent M16 (insulinase) family peptidase
MMLIRLRREKMAADIGYARSHRAAKIAKKRLAKAKSLATVNQAGSFYAEIYTALTSYIADKLNISPHGLTSERITELLKAKSAEGTVIRNVVDLIQKCDFARFAPASITQEDITESLAKAEQTIVQIEGTKFA